MDIAIYNAHLLYHVVHTIIKWIEIRVVEPVFAIGEEFPLAVFLYN